MIYDNDHVITKLINAEALCWRAGYFDVKPRNVCALAFRVEGSADMLCAGKRYFIDAGDVLYMPQGLGYQVHYTDTQMYAFHFVTERDDPEPEVFRLRSISQIHQVFVQAATIWSKKEPGYENFCTALLHQVLGHLCEQNMETEMPAHFRKALSYIHQHFCSPISIEALCHTVHISATAFRKYFQQYYGVTPTEYIRNLRLEYGRNLIAGGMSVEQAAQSCGIPDPKYFARLVRQKYDCTPRQLKMYGK